MAEEIHKTTVVEAVRAEWRARCVGAMARHTAETMRQIMQHSVTIDPEDDEGAAR